jgi:hypothetical protein
MTLRIPKPNVADRFLRLIGKKRAVLLPKNFGKCSHYQINGRKENFFKALIRPTNSELPEGTIDIFIVENLKK